MRKKPPAGLPNLNSGMPWSEMDLDDLANCLELGEPVEQIADFLCRDPDEVRARIERRERSPA
jgi:hypothetical protein